MDFSEFVLAFHEQIKVGSIFRNPKKGDSTVMSVKNGKVRYKREESNFYISIEVLYQAYSTFIGRKMSTKDLKAYKPEIFDQNGTPPGHGCNTTFLLCVLVEMNLARSIEGKGVSGDPFFVIIDSY
ncbi:MAG: hypothetical protein JZU70_06705 [Chlorobium sp.]|jgi:hypothetical protein|nr:hypothetical protein [Chlorobium sp.]